VLLKYIEEFAYIGDLRILKKLNVVEPIQNSFSKISQSSLLRDKNHKINLHKNNFFKQF
jgi:hypothetical protein